MPSWRHGPGSQRAGGDPYAAYLVYDKFTGTAGTAITSHTPDKDTVGGGWRQNSGTWSLNGANQLTSSAVNQSSIDIDSGQANVLCVTDLSFVAGNDAGIITRATDDSNYWLISANQVGGITGFYKRESGGFTQVGGNISVTWANGDLFAVTHVGSSCYCTQNSSAVGNIADTTYPSQKRHGLRLHVASSFAADNFNISAA